MKKALILFLSAALCCGLLAGCGGDDNVSHNPNGVVDGTNPTGITVPATIPGNPATVPSGTPEESTGTSPSVSGTEGTEGATGSSETGAGNNGTGRNGGAMGS